MELPDSGDSTRSSLLSRVRDASDSQAWREFEARYGELILRYARVRGLQHCDAEDIRQVVLLNLSRSLRGFEYSRQRGRFRDYLGRVVGNAVHRHLHRHNSDAVALDSSVLASIPAEPDENPPDELWEREWVDHHYRQAMEKIRQTFEPRSVEVFERIVAGETMEAIAEAYGVTAQSVRKIKQRVRERMNELIAAQVREEDDPDGRAQ